MSCPKCGYGWTAQDPLGALWCQRDGCEYVWWPPRKQGHGCDVHPKHDRELCPCARVAA